MPTSRNDILKKLEIFSGFFYVAVVGYKVNSSGDDSEAVKLLDNHFNIKDRRARMVEAKAGLEPRRINQLGGPGFEGLNARVKLNQKLLHALLVYHLNSDLLNLVLAVSTSASILGVWAENPLLSYCTAGIGLVSQSFFSYFQSYKSTQLTNQAFVDYDNEVRAFDML